MGTFDRRLRDINPAPCRVDSSQCSRCIRVFLNDTPSSESSLERIRTWFDRDMLQKSFVWRVFSTVNPVLPEMSMNVLWAPDHACE
jgi:hypothetical protein